MRCCPGLLSQDKTWTSSYQRRMLCWQCHEKFMPSLNCKCQVLTHYCEIQGRGSSRVSWKNKNCEKLFSFLYSSLSVSLTLVSICHPNQTWFDSQLGPRQLLYLDLKYLCVCLGTRKRWHLSRQHLSMQHLSISGISQLLLTQFWWG